MTNLGAALALLAVAGTALAAPERLRSFARVLLSHPLVLPAGPLVGA